MKRSEPSTTPKVELSPAVLDLTLALTAKELLAMYPIPEPRNPQL
jgi:hypothetical protein